MFIEEDNVSVHYYGDRVEIIDIANAVCPNKDCRTFIFLEHDFVSFSNMFFSKFISLCRAEEYKYAESAKPGAEIFRLFKGAAEQNLLLLDLKSKSFAKDR